MYTNNAGRIQKQDKINKGLLVSGKQPLEMPTALQLQSLSKV